MFADLFETDWASLSHAYGTAENVPQILQNMASEDPDTREIALDDFYGSIHHQGDVYDSTVACLPFLYEFVASPTSPGRGDVAGVLASLGESIDGSRQHGDADAAWRIPYREAEELIRSRAHEFVLWLSDAEAGVRTAAAAALVYFAPDMRDTVRVLECRLAEEPEVECRIAFIKAAADIAVRSPETAERVAGWLLGIVGGDADPGTRLAALVHLARAAPDRAVDDLTGRAVGLLAEISAHPGYSAAQADDRPATPTLIGTLRAMSAPEREGRAEAWTSDLVRTLHDALAERVADRIELIVDQLRHPDPGRRVDALRIGSQLIGRWRGPFEGLIRDIGTHLDAPEPGVRHMAALALRDTYDLGGPAADALAALVLTHGPDTWYATERETRDTYRMMLLALARLGDPRAVPGITTALAGGGAGSMLVQTLENFRDYRHKFEPDLLKQLAAVPAEIDRDGQDHAINLLSAVRQLGTTEAVPETIRILDAAMRQENRWVTQSALHVLKTIGVAARSAMPHVVRLAEHADTHIALLATEIAWEITREADEFLARLRPRLGSSDPGAAGLAAGTAAIAGTIAAPLADSIQSLIGAKDLWTRVRAATALIRITGHPGSLLPILAEAWQENLHTRTGTAECVADLGCRAECFLPLLRAELADPRRYTFRQGLWSNNNIVRDENLLKTCGEAVERISSGS